MFKGNCLKFRWYRMGKKEGKKKWSWKNNKISIFWQKIKYKLSVYLYKIRVSIFSIKLNVFLKFSIIYFLISIIIIFIAYKYNFFHKIDITTFFLNAWTMLWAIFALCITIHFFYIQNFWNYVALTFISDVNNSWKSYRILGINWAIVLLFFFLWWNHYLFIKQCPDYILFPISLVIISISLWLIIFYFNHVTKKLSPKWISEEVERYFQITQKKLQNFQKHENKYAKVLWIDKEKQHLLSYYFQPFKKVSRYKLETLCDSYLKLVHLNEIRLSQDFLLCIENCFSHLIDSYEYVYSSIELNYFTNTTEFDREINIFFQRVEWLMLMNVEKNYLEWIVASFQLYANMIVKTYYIKYSDLRWRAKNIKVIFYNLIFSWEKILFTILPKNNEEAFFQRKEWTNKIISVILDNQDINLEEFIRIKWLLEHLNCLNLRVIEFKKVETFNLYKIYCSIYLSILRGKIKDKRSLEILNETLYEFMGNNKDNIDKFIEYVRQPISINPNLLVINTENDKNYIKNMLLFMDIIYDITNYISKKEWLKIWNREWLLIQQLWLYMFNVRNIDWIDQIFIKQWLNKVIDIIDVVINSKNKVFVENVMAERDVYDQLCWIWVYAIKEKDNELFKRCFSIFSKHILEFSWSSYGLWEIKYFCYWLFIDEEKNYNKYFEILHRFFESELKKYWEHIDYWKKEIERLINEVNWCFNLEDWHTDIQISEFILKDEEWVKPENQEKITKLLFKHCRDILNPKNKK